MKAPVAPAHYPLSGVRSCLGQKAIDKKEANAKIRLNMCIALNAVKRLQTTDQWTSVKAWPLYGQQETSRAGRRESRMF